MAAVLGSDPRRTPIPRGKDKGFGNICSTAVENDHVVPVAINRAITLNFVIDSGAADVSIPLDVFSQISSNGDTARQ